MEMRDVIEEAKEMLKNRKPALHAVDFEKGIRELKTELYIKRDEVQQLRKDLDAANSELQTLRNALDVAKKSSDEYQFNLNLMLKKSRSNEEELQEKREALMKIQLQHKMTVASEETLKEKLQTTESEKNELSRKVEVLASKQRHNSVYHDEIVKRDNQLRCFIDELNKMLVKLQTQQVQAGELSKKAQLGKEAAEKSKLLLSENQKLKKEKGQLEEMYIQANIKFEKLNEMMRDGINKPNLIMEVIFNQWKRNISRHDEQIEEAREALNKVSESLYDERTANKKLILENEKLQEKNTGLKDETLMLKDILEKNGLIIDELNKKIKDLEDNIAQLRIESAKNAKDSIKEEPIEID